MIRYAAAEISQCERRLQAGSSYLAVIQGLSLLLDLLPDAVVSFEHLGSKGLCWAGGFTLCQRELHR